MSFSPSARPSATDWYAWKQMSWYESGEYTGRPSARLSRDCVVWVFTCALSAARARVATRAEAVALPRRCDRRAAEAGAEAARAQAVVCIAGEVCVRSVGGGLVDGPVTNGESVGDARRGRQCRIPRRASRR